MALTPKQARFVQEYLTDLNATQAAIRAGYSAKTATEIGAENLTKPHIAQAIEAAQKNREQRTQVTQDYVLKNLTEIVERCMTRAPVVTSSGEQATDADGKHVWKFDAKPAVAALALLGKHLGMFDETINLKTTAQLLIKKVVVERVGSSHEPKPIATAANGGNPTLPNPE